MYKKLKLWLDDFYQFLWFSKAVTLFYWDRVGIPTNMQQPHIIALLLLLHDGPLFHFEQLLFNFSFFSLGLLPQLLLLPVFFLFHEADCVFEEFGPIPHLLVPTIEIIEGNDLAH